MTTAAPNLIFKICPQDLWQDAVTLGRFDGAPIDKADGYIHFSTAAQVSETATRHFTGQTDLVLIAIDGNALNGDLRWEPSRGGDLFPHLYASLPLSAVRWTAPLPLSADGHHQFPDLRS